jgi:hypothetical protein
MRRWFINLPDADLAYFPEGSEGFGDYFKAVSWAQKYARVNREVMMEEVLAVLRTHFPDLATGEMAVNCHHNYVSKERHFGKEVYVTRKGAVRAGDGELGIIPGSMGARSFIVRGKGNPDSFCTCSHGAGRAMTVTQPRRVQLSVPSSRRPGRVGGRHCSPLKSGKGKPSGGRFRLTCQFPGERTLSIVETGGRAGHRPAGRPPLPPANLGNTLRVYCKEGA